jgi:hypothetical protein
VHVVEFLDCTELTEAFFLPEGPSINFHILTAISGLLTAVFYKSVKSFKAAFLLLFSSFLCSVSTAPACVYILLYF